FNSINKLISEEIRNKFPKLRRMIINALKNIKESIKAGNIGLSIKVVDADYLQKLTDIKDLKLTKEQNAKIQTLLIKNSQTKVNLLNDYLNGIINKQQLNNALFDIDFKQDNTILKIVGMGNQAVSKHYEKTKHEYKEILPAASEEFVKIDRMKLAEQQKLSYELVMKDQKLAWEISLGIKPAPEPLFKTSVQIALKQVLKDTGNADLANLIERELSKVYSEAGQLLNTAKLNLDGKHKIIAHLENINKIELGRKLLNDKKAAEEDAKKAVDKEVKRRVKKAKSEIGLLKKKQNARALLKSLICK
ncbi:MAG TPA: hypothetical protein PKX03_01870, partial [Candidatus Paceibacterota bacterium]|nr:hypothetical protein [Candidatus Paceibacterota bacterium]